MIDYYLNLVLSPKIACRKQESAKFVQTCEEKYISFLQQYFNSLHQ